MYDDSKDLFSDDILFSEGAPDANGLINIISWVSDSGHGSIALPEPYRISKTPEELHTLGMSLLNSPR